MSRPDPKALLIGLMAVIPLVVLIAALVAVLMVRSGYGLLAGAGIPFAGSLVVIVALSVTLGIVGSHSGVSKNEPESEPENKPQDPPNASGSHPTNGKTGGE